MTFELTRRNAGTVRAMFDEPALGAGIDELREDLDARDRGRACSPPVDIEYIAAAMVGVGVRGRRADGRARPGRPGGGGRLRDRACSSAACHS